MSKITDAQFPNRKNNAGEETFSYAELLAQLMIDLPMGGVVGTEGELVSFDAANVVENVPQGAAGNVLTANASGIPTFQAGGGGGGNAGLGALIRQTGGQNYSQNSLQPVDWSVNGGPQIEFDDFGMYNPAQPDRLSIPGGENITRVVQYLQIQWASNATGRRGLFSDRNQGSAFFGAITHTNNAVATGSHNDSSKSGPIIVTAGFSFLRMLVLQTTAGALQVAQAQMAVIVIRD
jgi:hypothetical protein